MESIGPFLDAISKGGSLGVAIILALLWYAERKERLQAQEKLTKLSFAMIKAINRSTNAIRSLRAVWIHGHDPTPEEYEPEDVSEIITDD